MDAASALVGYDASTLLQGNVLEQLLRRAAKQTATQKSSGDDLDHGPCMELLKNPLPPKDTAARRAHILALLETAYGPFKAAQVEDPGFVLFMTRLVDDAFFKGMLLPAIHARGYSLDVCSDLVCVRLTREGRIGTVHGATVTIHDKKAIHLYLNPKRLAQAENNLLLSTGSMCRRKKDIVLQTLEHELVHVFVAMFCPAFASKNAKNVPLVPLVDAASGHSNVFAAIAKARLGHLDYGIMERKASGRGPAQRPTHSRRPMKRATRKVVRPVILGSNA
jgi:hypothetical protein